MGKKSPLKGYFRVGQYATKQAAMKRADSIRRKFTSVKVVEGNITLRTGKTRCFRVWAKT